MNMAAALNVTYARLKEVNMALTEEEIEQLAERLASKIKAPITNGEMVLYVMEHEATGSARVTDPVTFADLEVPCRCFEYKGEEYCWKKGAIGLISPKRNPEQIAKCKIRVPAGEGVARRFARVKSAIGEAHKEWQEEKGGLKEWWEKTGEHLEKAGISI